KNDISDLCTLNSARRSITAHDPPSEVGTTETSTWTRADQPAGRLRNQSLRRGSSCLPPLSATPHTRLLGFALGRIGPIALTCTPGATGVASSVPPPAECVLECVAQCCVLWPRAGVLALPRPGQAWRRHAG